MDWLSASVVLTTLAVMVLLAAGSYLHHTPLDSAWAAVLTLVLGAAMGVNKGLSRLVEARSKAASSPDAGPEGERP